jgi:hypothetical protein
MTSKIFPGAFTAPFLMTLAISIMASMPATAQIVVPPGAGDSKTMAASACAVQFPFSPADLRVDSVGRIMNANQTHAISVVCPIMRDHADKALLVTGITVFDQNPLTGGLNDVRCAVQERDFNGNVFATSGVKTTGSVPTSTNILDLRSLGSGSLPGDPFQDYLTAFIGCSIPPAYNDGSGILKVSGLSAYRWKEDLDYSAQYPLGQ